MPNSSHRLRSRLPSLSALLSPTTTPSQSASEVEFPKMDDSERKRRASVPTISTRFPHSDSRRESSHDEGREHLHYRDDVPEYPLHLYDDLTGKAESPTALANLNAKEEEAMMEALAVSLWEMQRAKARENREAAELRRALEESATLARQTQPLDPKMQEQRELSQAILESRRQALIESKRHSSSYRHRTVSAPTAYTPPPLESPPVSLAESERSLLERNAKGRLYAEAGSHGWLPLGAGRSEPEEEIEQRELARAIALSVAEDQARQSMIQQMTSYITGDDSRIPSTSQIPFDGPIVSPIPSPLPVRSLLPSRPVPLPPTTDLSTPQPLSPTSPALRKKALLSVVIPPSPTTPASAPEANGSPTERPYLTPVSSYRSYFPAEEGSDEEEGSISRRASTGTFGEFTTPESSERSTDGKLQHGSSASGSRGTQSTDSHSNISHESFYSPIDVSPSSPVVSNHPGQHQQFYSHPSAGRSMSLISERTEPSSLSLPRPPASITTSPGSLAGSNTSRETLELVTPIQRSGSPNWFATNGQAHQHDHEITKETNGRAVEEQEEVFEVGVRFGFPAACAVDPHHTCLEDGLRFGEFPSEVVLSLLGGFGTFSVEAKTWNELLRFLLWYGDTEVRASPEDVKLERSRHCESRMTLDFRLNDEETGVVRLNIHLLSPNQSNQLSDLTLVTPPPAKGKAISQQMTTQTFQLADNLVLPLRLSAIPVALYTLRHLSGIYNTFESENPHAQSYRALAIALKRLSDEHHPPTESADSSERLVRRLRDRLRFWRTKEKDGNVLVGSTAPPKVAREGRAKLLKPPPPSNRTRNVDRDVRILTAENERESASSAEGTEAELRYLPRLAGM